MSKNELIIPPVAVSDPDSFEVVRCWVAAKALHVSLRPGTWEDPGAWGIVLADVIRHLANAYKESQGLDIEETVRRILALQMAEFDSPTDEPSGEFVKE
jgi:hypothetical protein